MKLLTSKIMLIPKLAIDNYRFTILLFILFTIAGINSYLFMPRTENPEMTVPGASVYTIYPGANPNDLEELVAIPIEETLNELDDIISINTFIRDGVTITSVEFDFNTNASKKYDEVVRQVNSIKNKLPEEVYSIETFRWSSSDVVMLQLGLVSETASFNALKDEAEKLKKDIEKLNGVKKTEIIASPDQEIRISLDFEKMAQMNISIDQISNALKSNNANIPGGSIDLSNKSFGIKTSGTYQYIDEIRNTVINAYKGQLIFLKNIAQVDYAYEDNNYFARYNGEKSIWICIQQKEGLNIFKLFENLEPVINDFEQKLDKNVQLKTVFNQKNEVNHRINGFQKNLLQGIVLVGLVILLALGFKSALIVIIAIPLSIIMGLFVVDISGFGLQQISIAGLVVALGLLVDNSIVMIENINRFISKGYNPKQAAIEAASEIGWPIISATITTVLAFIPIIMMPDKAGYFIRSLPITIVATLTFSLLIALTLTPLIASKLMKSKGGSELPTKERKNVNKYLNNFIEGPYRKLLSFSLRNKTLSLSIAFGLLLISGFVAFQYLPISFFPKAEKGQFMIRAELSPDVNIHKTDEVARQIEAKLDAMNEVSFYASNIGNGNPRIYYNVMTRSYVKNYAEIFVQLTTNDQDSYKKVVDELRIHFRSYAGVKIVIKEFQQGVPITAPIEVLISGKDFNLLKEIAEDVNQEISKQDGTINISNEIAKSRTDIFFNINKEKANMLGIPIHEIDKTIRTAINGMSVSKFRDKNGKDYNIVLRLPFETKIKPSDFDKIYVKAITGKMIPIMQLSSIELIKVPNTIARTDLERTARIIADVEEGAVLDEIMAPVLDYLSTYNFPEGYHYKIGGELESRNETFGGMAIALIIAIIAIFSVLVLQFKSFSQPLIIFIALPFALIGMIWALVITGNSFSFTAFVGMISLVGIVINNSIILVDYTNRLRLSGKSILESLQIAGETRFTPIILTTLTTIGGIVPLTLGGGTLWAPLGWTIVGGLLISTLLTLVMVPVLYAALIKRNT
ncbi:MAG: efflux RND transporter permease subunit [Bacteroidetes bacterium]|nr:efflux RND transporter permease subunit [Bacteroidota bacterium]